MPNKPIAMLQPFHLDSPLPVCRARPVSAGLTTILAGVVLIGCQSVQTEPAVANESQTPALEAPAPAAAAPLPEGAATFDAAWTAVRDTHFDPTYNGVDWEAVRDELRPQAVEATSTGELRAVLSQMIGRLGQSHFAIIPSEVATAMDPQQWNDDSESSAATNEKATDEAANRTDARDDAADATETAPAAPATDEQPKHEPSTDPEEQPEVARSDRSGDPGLDVRLIENEVVVTAVRADSPADRTGVRPGWMIEAIGTRQTRELIDRLNEDAELDDRFRAYQVWQVVQEQLRGAPGTTTQPVQFRDHHDEVATFELSRVRQPGVPVTFSSLPPMVAHVDDRLIEANGRRMGYIAFNIWMVPIAQPFHQAVDRYRECDGIIIDLRGNPGGIGGMSMGIAGHFFNDQQRLGTMKTRDAELNFVANPRRTTADRQPTQPYSGPVAILVDEGTASTSEIFAGGLQAVGRARIFGSTTMGAALPAQMTRLPNGDVLMHAFADYVDANGEHLEGRGVVPDEPVDLSRQQLLEGRDPVIDAAMEWIQSEATASGARARKAA